MKATKALIYGPVAWMFAGSAMLMVSGCYGKVFLPHPVGIVGDADGCPTAVNEREQDNCPPPKLRATVVEDIEGVEGVEGEQSSSMSEQNAQGVCVEQGDWIKWSREEPGGFEIDFEGESSPMQADCDLMTEGTSLKCRVSPEADDGAYKYSIVVADCEELDPHVIVK